MESSKNQQEETKLTDVIDQSQQLKKRKRKPAQIFAPKKIPIFLGIFSQDPKQAQQEVDNAVDQAINSLSEAFPDEKSFNIKGFKYPPSHHITSLFVGGAKGEQKTKTENYKNFEVGLVLDIEVYAIVYVPEKIIAGVCKVDELDLEVENKFPHLTMKVKDWPPKNSNSALSALFDKNGPLEQEYNSGIYWNNEVESLRVFNLNVEGEDVQVFLYKPKYVTKIPGKSAYH